jgi:hypothetical protein
MRTMSLMMGAAVLLTGGVASAQLAVPPGQDIPEHVYGYGAPYSPRNAPSADETTGRSASGQATEAAPTFEDRWSGQVAVPYLPPDVPIPGATTGWSQTQRTPASKDVPYSPQ